MEKRKAVFPSLPHLMQIYRRMRRKMDGEDGQWRCKVMGKCSHVPKVPRPNARVLSGIPDMRAACATRHPLPQIHPHQASIDEVPPFTLLVLRG